MDKPHYDYKTSSDGQYYFFDSIGKTSIPKAVGYILRNSDARLVELVFGDLIDNESIDVMNVSNNQDLPLVIGTVIFTLIDYLEGFPDNIVYFRGSTPSRTRLYRAIITKNLIQSELSYQIFGILDDENFELFNPNHHYQGYIIRNKYEN
jgi:hypothetical protein